ncbi:glucan endo-1 3-beta-glucosidase 5 [Phtheirospermum japonicum]|uniref:Glucan endo-1 3-beta-glucosidase 5 n=1 Tax=Phtheirospermum japonicum TaxID=374723 RepID=A0A830BVH2_9LAMI|nr:glucan endo-1 3-beta-glucosidase 5 [Phtheirospermum japonicum]
MDFKYLFMTILFSMLGERLLVDSLGCNWGLQAVHPIPPVIAVQLMKDNGFNKVKLFEADPGALEALGRSGVQVMVGIPNDMLARIASSVRAAEEWVQQNVSNYLSRRGVDIRYVAVGNEPFLKTYNDRFTQITFPALQNIQAALIKAGLGRDVKATVPLNADVYQSDSGLPSGGDFRADIRDLMVSIVKFLNDNGAPLTINIYPFLSLYADSHFPVEFAFFDGNVDPVLDGPISYTNVFDANYDTLITALEKNGFPNIPIIIGEVGWPTDGDANANRQMARRFNQGLINRINQARGTPKRPQLPDIYLFSLIDEDAKSVAPGNFERHWGVFYFDGTIKYPLDLGRGRNVTAAKGVRYLARQWCVMAPNADLSDPNLAQSLSLACTYADCTSLGYGSSCAGLDARSNASYAFNMYYQTMSQRTGSCEQFHNLSVVTRIDPGFHDGSCRFEIMIDTGRHVRARNPGTSGAAGKKMAGSVVLWAVMLALIVCGCFN